MGDGARPVRQGRDPPEAGGGAGVGGHGRARVHLRQRLPGHLQELRLRQAGAQPAAGEVREGFFLILKSGFLKKGNLSFDLAAIVVLALIGFFFGQGDWKIFTKPPEMSKG